MITFDDLSRAAVASHASGYFVAAKLPPSTNKKLDSAAPAAISPSAAESSQLQAALTPRTQVLHLGAAVGTLCSSLLTYAPLDPPDRNPLARGVDESVTFPPSLAEIPGSFWSPTNNEPAVAVGRQLIAQSMGSVFLALFLTASACGLDLKRCILKKLELNAKKYPVELCKGKSGKYTDYSHRTGITADRKSQSTVESAKDHDSTHSKASGSDVIIGNETDTDDGDNSSRDQSIAALTARIRAFATDRQWSRYHTPRNIVLAMMGEVGELAELFQWKGDGPEGAPRGLANFSAEDVDHVSQELADVSIYLMRLADVCGIDLAEEAMELTTGAGNA